VKQVCRWNFEGEEMFWSQDIIRLRYNPTPRFKVCRVLLVQIDEESWLTIKGKGGETIVKGPFSRNVIFVGNEVPL